jgi:predicted nucleic acid-binding Zn ribbon protein
VRDSRPSRPERIRELLEGFLDARGLQAPLDRASALPAWADVVGPQLARVSEATGFDGGVLFVRVRSSAWLAELKRFERELLRRLNDGRSHGRFDRIVFTLRAADDARAEEAEGSPTKER